MSKKAKPAVGAKVDLHDPEEWVVFFNEVKGAVAEVREMVLARNKKMQAGNANVSRDNAQIRKEFSGIERDVADLRAALKSLKKQISEKEVARRKDELDFIIQEKQAAEKLFKKPGAADVFNGAEDKKYEYDPNNEPSSVRDLENQQILDLQNKTMDQQDKNIAMLDNALDSTIQITRAIGDELDEHTKLLGTLDKEMGKTERNINKQTKRTMELLKKASLPCGIFCVVVLVLIIVVLIVVILVFGLPKGPSK